MVGWKYRSKRSESWEVVQTSSEGLCTRHEQLRAWRYYSRYIAIPPKLHRDIVEYALAMRTDKYVYSTVYVQVRSDVASSKCPVRSDQHSQAIV